LYKLLGGCILPLDDERRGYYSNNQSEIRELDEGIGILSNIKNQPAITKEYIACLEWVKEKILSIQTINYERFEEIINEVLRNTIWSTYEEALFIVLIEKGTNFDNNDLKEVFLNFTLPNDYRDIKTNIRNGILPPFTTLFSEKHEMSGNAYLVWAVAFLGNHDLAFEFANMEASIYLKDEQLENYIFSAVFLSEYILSRDLERSKNVAMELLKAEKRAKNRFEIIAEKLIKKHLGDSNQKNISDTTNIIKTAFTINKSICEKTLRIIKIPSTVKSFNIEKKETEFELEIQYVTTPVIKDGSCELVATLQNNTDRSFSGAFSLSCDDNRLDCHFMDESIVVTGYNKREFSFSIHSKQIIKNLPTRLTLNAFDEKQGISVKSEFGIFI
jgi:hypothetical protein